MVQRCDPSQCQDETHVSTCQEAKDRAMGSHPIAWLPPVLNLDPVAGLSSHTGTTQDLHPPPALTILWSCTCRPKWLSLQCSLKAGMGAKLEAPQSVAVVLVWLFIDFGRLLDKNLINLRECFYSSVGRGCWKEKRYIHSYRWGNSNNFYTT